MVIFELVEKRYEHNCTSEDRGWRHRVVVVIYRWSKTVGTTHYESCWHSTWRMRRRIIVTLEKFRDPVYLYIVYVVDDIIDLCRWSKLERFPLINLEFINFWILIGKISNCVGDSSNEFYQLMCLYKCRFVDDVIVLFHANDAFWG